MKKIILIMISAALLLGGCMANGGTEKSTKNQTTDLPTNVADTTLEVTEVALDYSQYDPSSITWGPGRISDHTRPMDPMALQESFAELGGKWLMIDENRICLTFDEGYENGYTAQILDTLKEKNVKAFFFCTYDYVRDNPELVQRMIDEGHIVGNHSYRHYNFTKIDVATATEEVTFLHDYMIEKFGYEMKYFRFPEGAFSEQALALVNSLGYETLFWSFAYADWDTSSPPDPSSAFDLITSSTHNGAIFLLHAVSSTNADILGNVIDNVRDQGYVFTTDL